MSENENGKHIHINATVITVVCLRVFCAVLFIMGKFGEKKLLKAANDVSNSNDTTEQQVSPQADEMERLYSTLNTFIDKAEVLGFDGEFVQTERKNTIYKYNLKNDCDMDAGMVLSVEDGYVISATLEFVLPDETVLFTPNPNSLIENDLVLMLKDRIAKQYDWIYLTVMSVAQAFGDANRLSYAQADTMYIAVRNAIDSGKTQNSEQGKYCMTAYTLKQHDGRVRLFCSIYTG